MYTTVNCIKCEKSGKTLCKKPAGHVSLIHNSLFETRCVCCGSNEHGLLRIRINTDGIRSAEFWCPVISHKTVFSMVNQMVPKYQYTPCHMKFATTYDYNQDLINEALEDFNSYGAANYMNSDQIGTLIGNIHHACEEYRCSIRFKRELKDDVFDLMEFDPSEETKDTTPRA